MPSIVTNFKFKSNAPNFERDQLSYEELCAIGKGFDPKDNSIKINPFEWYDLGHIVYCPDRHKYYSFATKYDSSSGELIKDEETGFFTVFDSGAGSNSDEYGNSAYRTVFAFTHSEETPNKPNGWKYDLIRQQAYPSILDENGNSKDGWFLDDSDLQPPVWMSIGEFNINFPDEEKWTTPVKISGEDGRPGTDGTQLEFIYTRSYSEEDGPIDIPSNDINMDDYVPGEAWKDSTGVSHYWVDNAQGVDQTHQCEWMCQRYKYVHEDGTYHWGGWNEKMEDPKPILWSKYGVHGKDGDGIEYIYNKTTDNTTPILPPMTSDFIETDISINNEGKVFQNDEYLPNGTFVIDEKEFYIEGWTDNPVGTTPEEQYEWVSVRKYDGVDGKWGAFSNPVIWAHYGKEGFTSFVFCRTNETPKTPIDGPDTSYENPFPIDPDKKVEWTDGIPEGSEMVWMSKKSFFNDHTDSQRAWSTPAQMTDTADFDVEFHDDEPGFDYIKNPPGEPGNPNNDINGWSDKATENTAWMATSTCKNGKWSAWSIVRIKGERGDDGTSVKILGRYASYEELINNYHNKSLANGKEEHNTPLGPQIGDAYIISVTNIDENNEWVDPYNLGGKLPTTTSPVINPTDPTKDQQFIMRGVLFSWDGDSWVNLGKFQGDGAYVHIKYSPNPDVTKIEWMVNENGEYVVVPGTELTNFPTQDLWEVPVNTKTGQKAKYIGMYTDNELKDSNDVNRYKWSKFIGDDGFGYEYIYIRTKTEQAPTIPAEKKPVRTDYNTDAEYEEAYKEYHNNGHMPVQPEDWKGDFWWTDEPSGVDEDYPYEWMAWRIWQQGSNEWSEWRGSNKKDENTGLPLAVLHAVWTNAGFTSFAFTRTNMDLSGWDMKDVTGTYKIPLPIMKDEDGIVDSDDIVGKTEYNGSTIIWSDSVPAPSKDNPYEIVWMTSAKFNLSMDGMNNHPQWSTPREMTDTSDLDVDWCPYGPETDPAITDPGNPDDNPNLWWETPYVGKANDGKTDWPAKMVEGESKPLDPVWMATRKLKNGEPIKGEPWVITRVKGEKGDPGTDGTSINIKGRYKYFMNPDDKDNSLYYNYLGPDGMDFNNGKYDGTLLGNNPPQEYDTYLVEYNNDDTNHGEYYTYIKEYEMLDENGDQLWLSWMPIGKLKGDPGAPTYTHIKYCPDADILNRPIKPEGGETQEYHEAVKAYNEKFKDLLWEVPVKKTDNGSINAKYLGICNNNNIEDPVDAFEYTWSKFGGDDGFGYEYIYMRNNDPVAPPVPATSSPEDGVLPIKPKDWNKETWWTDIMTGVDSENKYEWMCWRKKSTNVDGIYAWGPWLGSEGKGAPNGVASLINYYSEKEYSTICALDVEPVTIKIDKFGKYSSESINVKVFTKKGDEKYLYEGENGAKVPPGYKVKAYYKVEDNKVIEEDITESLTFDVVNKKPIDNIVNIGLYQNDMQLDFESIPILEDEDNIIADLSNDRYAITCNNFGSPVNSSEIVETEFKLYYGLDDVELHTVTVSYEGSSITIDDNSKESEKDMKDMNGCSASLKFNEDMKSTILTVTKFDESAPLAMNFKFEADAIIKGEHRTGTAIFIINKVIPGGKTPTLYQMIPSATTITQSKTGSNTPTSISVKVVKIEGTTDESQSKTTVLNKLDSGLSIVAYKDGNYGDKIDLSYSNGSSTVVATDYIAERLEFRLIHQNEDKSYGEIHDLYIPVIKEGQDGITPTIYQIKPDVTTIRVSGTESNPQYAVGTINFDLMKVSGNQITNLSGSSAAKEGDWKYGIDGADVDETFSNSLNINTLKPKTMITVDFWKSNKKLDRVMIPVVTDGVAGETTTVYSLHTSSGTIKYDQNGVGYPQSLSASVLYTAGNRIESLIDSSGDIKLYAVLDKGSIEVYLNDQNTTFNESKPDTDKSISYGSDINGWSSSDESVKFYLYKNNVLIDKETIPILVDGKNGEDGAPGESAVVANLTNDMIAIQCDANGNPIGTSPYTTTFELYHGTTKLTPTVSVNITLGGGVKTSVSGSTITISEYSSMSDTVEITITGTSTSTITGGKTVSLSKVLKVVKVKKGSTGATGNGIVSFTEWYALNNDNKNAPGGIPTNGNSDPSETWSTTAPTPDSGNKYLWNFEIIRYTNGNASVSDPKIISMYIKGDTGAPGAGVKSTTVSYAVTDDYVSNPNTITSWDSKMPNASETQYLWTRTIVDYSDESVADTVTYTYSYQGKNGTSGKDGTTISEIKYAAGSSPTTAPTGSWSGNPVSVQEGQYLWTRTTFSDGKVAYGVARQGVNGANGKDGASGKDGDDGRGITNIVEYYMARASGTPSSSDSGWKENISETGYNSTNKYLWNYTRTYFTDGTNIPTTPCQIGVWGSEGKDGASGLILYPAGEWKSGTYTQTKDNKGNYRSTPFVYIMNGGVPTYYILDKSSSSNKPGDSSDWIQMQSYGAVYSDIGIFTNALVGQAVFYKNWIYSQAGTGGTYDKFSAPDSGDPYTGSGFKPNWAVNLVTGDMYSGCGACKFKSDGSGQLANGNIFWQSNGNIYLPPNAHITATPRGISLVKGGASVIEVSGAVNPGGNIQQKMDIQLYWVKDGSPITSNLGTPESLPFNINYGVTSPDGVTEVGIKYKLSSSSDYQILTKTVPPTINLTKSSCSFTINASGVSVIVSSYSNISGQYGLSPVVQGTTVHWEHSGAETMLIEYTITNSNSSSSNFKFTNINVSELTYNGSQINYGKPNITISQGSSKTVLARCESNVYGAKNLTLTTA